MNEYYIWVDRLSSVPIMTRGECHDLICHENGDCEFLVYYTKDRTRCSFQYMIKAGAKVEIERWTTTETENGLIEDSEILFDTIKE